MKQITVLLSDDRAIVRRGLRNLLEKDDNVRVVGEADNGHESVAETARLQPHVVVQDLAMPLLNGVEVTRQIARDVPATRVLVLSSEDDARQVWRAIEAGASGSVTKESTATDLLLAVHEVCLGNFFFSPRIFKGLLEQWRAPVPRARPRETRKLTVRQMEVLKLIAEGYTTGQTAVLLSIARKTVESHRQAIMEKLDLHNIACLTRYAIAVGVVEVDRALPMRIPYQPVSQAPIWQKKPAAENHQTCIPCGQSIHQQ